MFCGASGELKCFCNWFAVYFGGDGHTWVTVEEGKIPRVLLSRWEPHVTPERADSLFSAWLNSVLLGRSNCSQTPCESIVFAHRLTRDNGTDHVPYPSVGSEYNVVCVCVFTRPDSYCVIQLRHFLREGNRFSERLSSQIVVKKHLNVLWRHRTVSHSAQHIDYLGLLSGLGPWVEPSCRCVVCSA